MRCGWVSLSLFILAWVELHGEATLVGGLPHEPEPEPELQPEPELSILETPYVFVVAGDYASAHYVEQLAEALERLVRRYLPLPEAFSPPLRIQLLEPGMAPFTEPYRLSVNEAREVVVSVRWHEQTDFSLLCQGMTQGFMTSWALSQYGLEGAGRTPPWLPLALGVELEVMLHPRYQDHLREQSQALPTYSLEELTAEKAFEWDELAALRLDAYWLFELLKADSLNPRHLSGLLQDILSGTPTLESMERFLRLRQRFEDRELWWAVRVQAFARAWSGALYSTAESTLLLERLETLGIDLEGKEVVLKPHDIFPYRNLPATRAAVMWRLREIKFELNRVNPVYFNAFHSLGQLYEGLLDPKAERFEFLEIQYAEDKDWAQTVATQVEAGLDRVEAEGVQTK